MNKVKENKLQKRTTSTLISEVTGIPDSTVRQARNGFSKNAEVITKVTEAETFLENGIETLVKDAKSKFLNTVSL